jgi:hypothetical protein
MFGFLNVSELDAQTKHDLGSAASEQVIQKIEDEMAYLQENGTTSNDEDYLYTAYERLLIDFNDGDDLFKEFAVVIEGSDELTSKLFAQNPPSSNLSGGDVIREFFSGIQITPNDLSGVDEALIRIRTLENQ